MVLIGCMNGWSGRAGVGLSEGSRILGFDSAREPTAGSERAGYISPDGLAGLHDVVQNAIDGIFVKDTQVAVGIHIHLERFQFEAFFIWHVMNGNGSEIRQGGLGADGGIFRNLDRDLIAFVLIGERLDIRQRRSDSTSGVALVIAWLGGSWFFRQRFMPYVF